MLQNIARLRTKYYFFRKNNYILLFALRISVKSRCDLPIWFLFSLNFPCVPNYDIQAIMLFSANGK